MAKPIWKTRAFSGKTASLLGLTSIILAFQNCTQLKSTTSSHSSESSSSLNFAAAKAVLQKNCFACHSNQQTNAPNLNYATEEEYLSAGLISAGNVDMSKLIFRLRNYTGTATGPRNMPPTGAISTADYNTLVNWVRNVNPDGAPCAPDENLLRPQVKRLTQKQFQNSIQNAFGAIFTDSQFPTLNDGNPRNGLANDPDRLNVNEVNINSYYDSALSISATARAQVSDLQSCANAANDNCLSTLITNYGLRLWRRPVSTAERADLMTGISALNTVSATRTQKVEYLLTSLILSPNHLFRTELGSGTGVPSGIFQLGQYEVASLLSFSLWDGPPDTTLLNLAQNGQLHSAGVLKAQVARMSEDAKFSNQMSTFIVDLLKIEDVKTISKDASFNLTANERTQLYNSAMATLNAAFNSPEAHLLAPFSSQSFYANQSTARFFGLNQGSLSANLTPVNLPAQERHGILSHPAFLTAMSGQVSSGIVKRGVFTLVQLLCYHLEPAPANISGVLDLPAGYNPDLLSSREVLRISHSSQTRCIGCHSAIDPAGFGFESFNALGQFRLTEKAANIPIDSSGRIAGVTRREIAFSNSVQYFQSLADKQEFKACVQKHLFKYASGQSAKTGPGRCEYRNFEAKINVKGNGIQSIMESMVELESFTRRRAQ